MSESSLSVSAWLERLKQGEEGAATLLWERYFRPLEVDTLIADTTKTRAKLNWEARIKFNDLIAIMVDADLEALGLKSPGRGKTILEEKIGPWNRWHNSVIRVAQAVQGQASQH